MPFFKRNKQAKNKPIEVPNGTASAPVQARWQSTWTSTEVLPEEIQELVHFVTAEMKLRAEALDSPFLLLPFRPSSDPSSARTFINTFFKSNASGSQQYRGDSLQQELRLTNPTVLCSILKWCWSRMPKGVVSWAVYDSFKYGEKEAGMARNAFDTFIPLGSDSTSRTKIIVDFFDLIATVAAHGKLNGFGGRKLSRLAGWWAFEHSDNGKGFEGGYKSWSNAADASSHLFFAYLRSLSPDVDPSMNVIERIPRSLQALLAQTEYPPEAPALLQRTTPRVVMVVDQVSPSPFSLLRRAKHFEYRQNDRVLKQYSEFDDPVDALTDECKRVLYAIASTNSSGAARSRHGGLAKPDETWSAFTSVGFSDINSELTATPPARTNGAGPLDSRLRSTSQSNNTYDRPTTPSWGDFLSSGFQDEVSQSPSTMLLPPDKVLPPINGPRTQTPSVMSGTDIDEHVTPGELAAITSVELDDAFWWVWMTSLAGEEPNERKAVFGRCALIETTIMKGKWLIMEEQVQGASPEPIQGAQLIEKKSRFSFTRRSKLGRGQSIKERHGVPPMPQVPTPTNAKANRMTIDVDQQAKIKAAAAELARKNDSPTVVSPGRRGRHEDATGAKTHSTLTMGLQSEAGPAMKWANSYDKDTVKSAYLGSNLTGTGNVVSTDDLVRGSGHVTNADDTISHAPVSPVVTNEYVAPKAARVEDRPLPAVSPEETTSAPVYVEERHIWEPAHTDAERREPSPLADHTPQSTHTATPVSSPYAEHPAEYAPMAKDFGMSASSLHSEHPAFRRQHEAINATRSEAPAVLAARKALERRAVSPESTTSSKLAKQSGSGGLKKFFSRKKEKTNNRYSREVNPGAVSAASDAVMSRQLAAAQHEEPRAQHYKPAAATAIMPSSHGQYNDSSAGLSRVDTEEQRDADIAFSQFDQGPMTDMPAVVPRDSVEFDDAAEPPVVARYSPRNQQSALFPPPQPQSDGYHSAHERMNSNDDAQSEATMESRKEMTPAVAAPVDTSKDRWERIRENAARRAANARASEDTSLASRPTDRTDDGETSGEETIESRVARIKARVAELTSNMNTAPEAPRQ